MVWSILVLLGIEKLHIVPGFTEANPLNLYYMPLISISLHARSAGRDRAVARARRHCGGIGRAPARLAFLVIAAAAFSHWILDLIVHIPDLPLYDNIDKVGFGLWRHVALSFPLELAVLLIGAWLYARALPPAGRRGHIALRGFVVLLALLQVYANFGPAPSSETAMAIMALGLYIALAVLAAVLERMRAV